MENRIPRIWAQVEKTPWAILPEKLDEILAVLHLAAERDSVPMEAAVQGPQQNQMQSVAVLPLFGMISQRVNILTKFSGGTSTELFSQSFRQVLADPQVSAIVIEADSPGGNVNGVPELAAEILRSRGRKPIVAVANSMAASAAYWIASAADELIVTPSGKVGSIGVLAVYPDSSGLEGKDGVVHRVFSAGKYKAEANPYEPLGDEAAQYIQSEVDRYYDMFTAGVAKARNRSQAEVISGFGQGRMVGAKDAVKLGMANRVATLDETIARLMRAAKSSSRQAAAAEAEPTEITASTWLPPVEAAEEPEEAPAAKPEPVDPIADEARRSTIDYL